MAARTGMANLIARLRGLCDVGTAEWTKDGTAFWNDDQLEERLDLHVVAYKQDVNPAGELVDGTTEYHKYPLSFGNLEEAASGTAHWVVRNTGGTAIGTASYSVNYEQGLITFPADTTGSIMTARYKTYDMWAAGADIWRTRAANVHSRYNIREGEHALTRAQWFDHCLKMASQFDVKSGGAGNMQVRMVRSDVT